MLKLNAKPKSEKAQNEIEIVQCACNRVKALSIRNLFSLVQFRLFQFWINMNLIL